MRNTSTWLSLCGCAIGFKMHLKRTILQRLMSIVIVTSLVSCNIAHIRVEKLERYLSKRDDQIILKLLNEVRANGATDSNGSYYPPVGPLVLNRYVSGVSYEYIQTLSYGNFGHGNFKQRSIRLRMDMRALDMYVPFKIGENIAIGFSDNERLIKAWVASPGHCRNLMDGDFKYVGIANGIGEEGTPVYGNIFFN
jgi:uncharacterized protein YkwD